MVLNLGIFISLLFLPNLSWTITTGPELSSLIAIATMGKIIIVKIPKTIETTISTTLLKKSKKGFGETEIFSRNQLWPMIDRGTLSKSLAS